MISQSFSGSVLTLTIDNPHQANSLTADMLVQLRDAVRSAPEDESCTGVLLTGAGDRGFSAGMNTEQFDHSDPERAHETIALLGSVCEAVKSCELPVAAAVKGYCIGGALEIAAAADFRIGSEDSWYSMPEVRIGIPSVLESANLPRIMGWTKAVELILTAQKFDAETMERCGFLNRAVPGEDVEAAALRLLQLTAESGRTVIAQQKRLFRTWKNSSEEAAIADSMKEFALSFARRGA